MNDDSGLRVTGCPQCGAPAEVVPEGRLGSTDGPVEIVRVRCADRHWFLMAEDQLTPAAPRLVPDQGSSSDARTSPSPRATSRRPPGPSGAQASACTSQRLHIRASVRISARTD
jgi:hypothetical protein